MKRISNDIIKLNKVLYKVRKFNSCIECYFHNECNNVVDLDTNKTLKEECLNYTSLKGLEFSHIYSEDDENEDSGIDLSVEVPLSKVLEVFSDSYCKVYCSPDICKSVNNCPYKDFKNMLLV